MSSNVEGEISNLSFLLLGIIAQGLPSEWLLIETIPRHELSDHLLKELFQFFSYYESSKLGVLPLEKSSQSSQMPMDTVDTQ
jgi:hypothetical protein